MAYIETVVNSINSVFAGALCDGILYGVATLLPKKEGKKMRVMPCTVHEGEGVYVGIEDKAFSGYHRILGITTVANNRISFGDSDGVTERVNMCFVGGGDELMLRRKCYDVAVLLNARFPQECKDTKIFGIRSTMIRVNEINLDKMQVFNDEYSGSEYFLKPEQFIFKISYTIESTYLKECFNTKC